MNLKAKSARSKINWIGEALDKHPGELHRQLHVPKGDKIPMAKLTAAAHGDSKLAKRARLALTLRTFK